MSPSGVAREQQIAVFGESGSGKTVLVSSFYGAAQEAGFKKKSEFDVIADDAGQGTLLHQNYLGMKNSNKKPTSTKLASTAYSFSIKRRHFPAAGTKSPGDLRLVWHDYPGEWFEQEPSGPVEAKRRVDTFRALLRSDVAFIMVDAQKLLDNAGEEERYLKSLFANFSNGIIRLRDDILLDGKPFVRFPRIWVLALSKADLMPLKDVLAFRDLLVEKAGSEIIELRDVLAGLVEAPQALSVGEDFVLLSSAKFEPGRIEVQDRIGLDLVLPLAAMLPFTRFLNWAKIVKRGSKVADEYLSHALPLAVMLAPKIAFISKFAKAPGPIGIIAGIAAPALAKLLEEFSGNGIRELHQAAVARHDFLASVLTGFQMDLDQGEKDGVLLRSLK